MVIYSVHERPDHQFNVALRALLFSVTMANILTWIASLQTNRVTVEKLSLASVYFALLLDNFLLTAVGSFVNPFLTLSMADACLIRSTYTATSRSRWNAAKRDAQRDERHSRVDVRLPLDTQVVRRTLPHRSRQSPARGRQHAPRLLARLKSRRPARCQPGRRFREPKKRPRPAAHRRLGQHRPLRFT